MRAAGLVTAVRTLGQGVVARARALATSGPSSQSAPRTAMSAWGPAEEVDEGVERHGADWQGIKEPYQLELTPSMGAIRPWGHHAIRMKDAFWPWMAASCWTIQMPREASISFRTLLEAVVGAVRARHTARGREMSAAYVPLGAASQW